MSCLRCKLAMMTAGYNCVDDVCSTTTAATGDKDSQSTKHALSAPTLPFFFL